MTTEQQLQAMFMNPARRRLDMGMTIDILYHVPRIYCADGFNMSVQTGKAIYCSPRDSRGPWHKVEVGFPSERVEELMEYAEDPTKPVETVYGYVPLEVVVKVVDAHGGIATDEARRAFVAAEEMKAIAAREAAKAAQQ